MSNTNKREYTEPDAVEVSLISAAAAMSGPNDYPGWRIDFIQNLREVTAMSRQFNYRDIVADLLSENSKPFAATIRGFAFHDSSQRYVLQLESEDADGQSRLEYINTNRVDSDPTVEALIDRIEDELLDNRVLVYKLVESKGDKKYRNVAHVQNLGPADDSVFATDELEHDLADHVDAIGKASSRR